MPMLQGPLPSAQSWKNVAMFELRFSPLVTSNSGCVTSRGLTSLHLCMVYKGLWCLQSVRKEHLQSLFCREAKHLDLKYPEDRYTKFRSRIF